MGMYTSIRHPADGRELQIKTGKDDCNWYSLGDVVAWSVEVDHPRVGTLLDGAYRAHDDSWVIIKDHKVHDVVEDTAETTEESLLKHYAIEALPDSAWTEEGWARKKEREEAYRIEYQAFLKANKGLTAMELAAMELAAKWAGQSLRKRFSELSLAQRLFRADNKSIEKGPLVSELRGLAGQVKRGQD